MAIELWIDDGDPWYLSPDIWVVPSDDPNDPPAPPFEGVSAYLWARVHNRGTSAVSNAQVRYYWADPSTAITRATATLIGQSSVSLAAGETKDVLCVTPWIPAYVNGGHECLIAEAYAPGDPLPPHGPGDPFNVPTDRHVAQRNITVGMASARMMMVHPFLIGNVWPRAQGRMRVRARRASIKTLEPLARSLGLRRLPEEAPEFKAFGVKPYRCGQPVDEPGKPEWEGEGEPGSHRTMALIARIPERLPGGTGALFLVEQLLDDEILGGVAVLVLPEGKRRHHHHRPDGHGPEDQRPDHASPGRRS